LQYVALILTFAVPLLFCGIVLWWFYYCKSPPKYNGLLWVHPDKGGGMIGITKEPGLQKPYYFNYRLLEFGIPFFRHPLWLWKQDKVKDYHGSNSYPIVHWEPTVPADFELPSNAGGEADKTKPFISPNELFDTTDWDCLGKLETAKSGWQQTVKLGVAVVMVCVCVFGIIVALDMIGKKDTQPIQTNGKPVTQIIQQPNYGGLLIW